MNDVIIGLLITAIYILIGIVINKLACDDNESHTSILVIILWPLPIIVAAVVAIAGFIKLFIDLIRGDETD